MCSVDPYALHSLVLIDAHGDFDDPHNWRASVSIDGSPGEEDPEPEYSMGVVIGNVHIPAKFNVEIEAEDMPVKTTGVLTAGGWNIWSNGYIADDVVFPAEASYTFEIAAKGDYAGGTWPVMALRIDQTEVATVTVDASDRAVYTIQASVAAGTHEVAVAFTNNWQDASEDRNLYVEEVVITPSGGDDPDAIELHNTTDAAIDIGGWFIADEGGDPSARNPDSMKMYKVPDDTVIAAHGYWSCDASDFGENNPLRPFGLSEYGESVFLYSADSSGNLTGYMTGATGIGPSDEPKWRYMDSSYVFDDDALHTFELLISEDSLAYLDNDPRRREYVKGALVFDGETVGQVGVRYKGEKGAWAGCAEEGKPKTCPKLSMKIKINTDGHEDRLFYGLRKLQFHSMNHSPSQLSERFAYWVYREMGSPAPRAVHARLRINGTLQGLYLLVEQIDGRFTRHHLVDGGGNVYKDYWPLEEDEITSEESFLTLLETNEEDSPDFSIAQGFEQELLKAAHSHEELMGVMRKWVDVDLLVRQIAAAVSANDWDGPFMGAFATGHNTYWAEEPASRRIMMIPWDADMPEWPGWFIGFITEYRVWSQAYPDCPDEEANTFRKTWFCFYDEWESAFERLSSEIYPRVDSLLVAWEERIRPTIQELSETTFDMPPGTAISWHPLSASAGNYPHNALTVADWESGIADYRTLLERRRAEVEKMEQTIGR